MHFIKTRLSSFLQTFSWQKKSILQLTWSEVVFYAGILVVFLINATYLSFPDEFVNLLGGRATVYGQYPYVSFFDHHLPFAWYLSGAIQVIAGSSFILFRIIWAIIMFVLLASVAIYIKRSNPELYKFYLCFFFLYPFIAVYFWLHLFVADALAALFASISFWITVNETFRQKPDVKPILIASFVNFALLFSSLTFLYFTFVLYVWQFYIILRNQDIRKHWLLYGIIAALPYLIYGIHTIVTGQAFDFYMSNIAYNRDHYVSIPNYQIGRFINPLKLGLTIVFNMLQEYIPLLTQIPKFDLFFPLLPLTAISSVLFMAYLLIQHRTIFFLYFFLFFTTSPRSSIVQIQETGYQGGVFYVIGISTACLVLYAARTISFKDEVFSFTKKALVFLVIFYGIFLTIASVKNTYDKTYKRYTHVMPSIRDESSISQFIDRTIEPGEDYWIGPFEPHHAYFVNTVPYLWKYPTLLPQFREGDYFKNDFLRQFEQRRPEIIILKNDASIFMTPVAEFGAFFKEWMSENGYVRLSDIESITIVQNPTNFTLADDIYIESEAVEVFTNRLIDEGFAQRQ